MDYEDSSFSFEEVSDRRWRVYLLRYHLNRVIALSMSMVLILTIIPNTLNVTYPVSGGKYGDITPTSYELELLNKINENRTENSAVPLKLNASLIWVARAHSQDMIDYDFFDHVSSEDGQFDGATFQERVLDYAEYENGYVGECIAYESWGIDPEGVMSMWKNSPGHWNIIINPNFREIGIGLLEGDWDGWTNAGLHTAAFGGHSLSVDLLTSSQDIEFDPVNPYEGREVNIQVTIYNKGITDAHPVEVKFFDGDPQSLGILIDTIQIPQILIHGEETTASALWDTKDLAGEHDIYVIVDHDNIISESNEINNIGVKSLTVEALNPSIILEPGWNLVSFPYNVTESNLENVLSSINGKYDIVSAYDPLKTPSQWLHYNSLKPPNTNQLLNLNNNMGFWIHINQSNQVELIVNGDSPSAPSHIQLYAGWNLIGYPSETKRARVDALNNLVFGDDVDIIQWYDSQNQTYLNLKESDFMESGWGYFIHAKQDCSWIVNP